MIDYFRYCERVYDLEQGTGLVLPGRLTSLGLILNSIFLERHTSTDKEDMLTFVEIVSRSEDVPDKDDERLRNKPTIKLFDKFCLLESNSFFDVQYVATMILTQTLNFYFEQEKREKLKELQNYVLAYSI